jgi:hypothetical protein
MIGNRGSLVYGLPAQFFPASSVPYALSLCVRGDFGACLASFYVGGVCKQQGPHLSFDYNVTPVMPEMFALQIVPGTPPSNVQRPTHSG